MGEHYSPCPIYFRQTSVSPPNCHKQEGPEIHSLNFLCNLMTSVNIDYLWQSNWLKASSKRSITEQNACYGECWESDREGEWVVHSIRPSIAGRRQWLLMTSDVNIGVTGEVPLHFANYRFDVTIPWNLVPTIWLGIIIFLLVISIIWKQWIIWFYIFSCLYLFVVIDIFFCILIAEFE